MNAKLTEYETMTAAEMHEIVHAVYLEVCLENAALACPVPSALPAEIQRAEDEFVRYLEGFFAMPENRCYVLHTADGAPVCAARLTQLDGFYYLEALETAPVRRGCGCATELLTALTALLRERGGVDIRCCVRTTNAASLAVHSKCGFRLDTDPGINYLTGEECPGCYGLRYTEAAEVPCCSD